MLLILWLDFGLLKSFLLKVNVETITIYDLESCSQQKHNRLFWSWIKVICKAFSHHFVDNLSLIQFTHDLNKLQTVSIMGVMTKFLVVAFRNRINLFLILSYICVRACARVS